jgi:Na+-transporting methylmalonyl-CoA/oxaloacetate decarboxylase beta subunit
MGSLLWYVPLPLLVLLLWLLIRRHAYRVCPYFFSYVAFGVAATAARFLVRNQALAYKAVYWATEASYCVLGILAMYEVFRSVLRARSWWTRLIFPTIVVSAMALSLARTHAVPSKFAGLYFYIVTAEIAVRFVQVFIFIGLGGLASFFGLRWRQYPLGIAAGFGLYSTVYLLTTIKFSDFGTGFKFWWDMSSIVAYSLAVLIWIWFFRAPQSEEPPLDPKTVAQYLTMLEQYKNWMRRMR